jgi:hypothetical protein
MTPEKKIKKQIMDYLKTLEPDLYAWTVEQRPGMGRGHPDIMACLRGKIIAMEVKVQGGRTTALQERFLKRITLAGGLSAVVHSVEEVKNLIGILQTRQ